MHRVGPPPIIWIVGLAVLAACFYFYQPSEGQLAPAQFVFNTDTPTPTVTNTPTQTPTPTATPTPDLVSNLQAHIQFDETPVVTTSFADSSGNGNAAVCSPSSQCPDAGFPGQFGSGVNFNAAQSDQLAIGIAADPSQYTIAAWVYLLSTGSQDILVRTNSNGPVSDFSHFLRTDSSGKFSHYVDTGTNTYSATAAGAAGTHQWYCVVGTSDGTYVRLYIDGALETETSIPGAFQGLWSGGDRWAIGPAAGLSTSNFASLMDDVRIYDRALRTDEVAQLCAVPATTPTPWPGPQEIPNTPVGTFTFTPTFTATVTHTPTVTATPTITLTPTPTLASPEQGQFFGNVRSNTNETPLIGFSGPTAFSNQSNPKRLPLAVRVRNLYVNCRDGGPGASKTLTFALLKNGSVVTGSDSCVLAGAGTGDGISRCDQTFANTSDFDFAAGDIIAVQTTQSASASTGQTCHFAMYYRQAGDAGEQDAMIMGHDGTGSIGAGTSYCGGWSDATATSPVNPTYICGQATSAHARHVIPRAGTLTGLAMRSPAYSNTGAFTILVNDTVDATDLSVSLTSGTLSVSDTTCTTNCSVDQAELMHLEMVQSGGSSGSTSARNWMISLDGMGQVYQGSNDVFGNTANVNSHMGPSGAAVAGSAQGVWPVAKRSTMQNLCVHMTSGDKNGQVIVTARKGTDPASLSNTAVTCTTGSGTGEQSCCDTTHHVGVEEGEYVEVHAQFIGTPSTPRPIAMGMEMSGDPTDTPTQTPTPTGTLPTSTPTATVTHTSTPTFTPGGTQPNWASGCFDGNAADNRQITTGFQPDWVFLSWDHSIGSSRIPVFRSSSSPLGDASCDTFTLPGDDCATTNNIQALNATGFEVGTASNDGSFNYCYLALQNLAGHVQEGRYVGTGTDNRAIDVGFVPDVVLVYNVTNVVVDIWSFRTADMPSDFSMRLNQASGFAETDRIQDFLSIGLGDSVDGFEVGTVMNTSSRVYYWVALKQLDNFMEFGHYTATGADDFHIDTGSCSPDMVLIAADESGTVAECQRHAWDDALWPMPLSQLVSGFTVDNRILSIDSSPDGFTVDAICNDTDAVSDYHWLAFCAEEDFPTPTPTGTPTVPPATSTPTVPSCVTVSSSTMATVSTLAGPGDVDWTNQADLSDGCNTETTEATFPQFTSGNTAQLRGQAYSGLGAIPDAASITGIKLDVTRRLVGPGVSAATDQLIKLIRPDGNYTSTNKADLITQWPSTLTLKSYGGLADTWGQSWTGADVKDPDFGVVISAEVARDDGSSADALAEVDCATITICYDNSASPTPAGLVQYHVTPAPSFTGSPTATPTPLPTPYAQAQYNLNTPTDTAAPTGTPTPGPYYPPQYMFSTPAPTGTPTPDIPDDYDLPTPTALPPSTPYAQAQYLFTMPPTVTPTAIGSPTIFIPPQILFQTPTNTVGAAPTPTPLAEMICSDGGSVDLGDSYWTNLAAFETQLQHPAPVNNELTLEAWLRFDHDELNKPWIARWNSDDTQAQYVLRVSPTTAGVIECCVHTDTGTQPHCVASPSDALLNDGLCHHVLCRYNDNVATGNGLALWVDGVKVATNATAKGNLSITTQKTRVFCYSDNRDCPESEMCIQHVALYDFAVSEERILKHARACRSGCVQPTPTVTPAVTPTTRRGGPVLFP